MSASEHSSKDKQVFDLRVVSPSIPPIQLSALPIATTVSDLKTLICQKADSHPPVAHQRLIYRGHPLLSQNQSLRDLFTQEVINSSESITLHLVLPPQNVPNQTVLPAPTLVQDQQTQQVDSEQGHAGLGPSMQPGNPRAPAPMTAQIQVPHATVHTTTVTGIPQHLPPHVQQNMLQFQMMQQQMMAQLASINNNNNNINIANNNADVGSNVAQATPPGPSGQHIGIVVNPAQVALQQHLQHIQQHQRQVLLQRQEQARVSQMSPGQAQPPVQQRQEQPVLSSTPPVLSQTAPVQANMPPPVGLNAQSGHIHEHRPTSNLANGSWPQPNPAAGAAPTGASFNNVFGTGQPPLQQPQVASPPPSSTPHSVPAASNNSSSAMTMYVLSSPTGPAALLVAPSGQYVAALPTLIPVMPPLLPQYPPPQSVFMPHGHAAHNPPGLYQTVHSNVPAGAHPVILQHHAAQAVPNHMVASQPQPQQPQQGQPQPQGQQQVPQAQMQPQPQGARDIVRIAIPLGGHVWLLVRLLGFVWFFSYGAGTSRTIMLLSLATLLFLAQTGIFTPLMNTVWAPMRRHVENILPLAGGGPQRVVPTVNGNAAGSQNAPRNPNLSPEESARFLLERQRQESLSHRFLRRMERAVALFLASLVPGVGERHVAAQEEALRQLREQTERAMVETEEKGESSDTPIAPEASTETTTSSSQAQPESSGSTS